MPVRLRQVARLAPHPAEAGLRKARAAVFPLVAGGFHPAGWAPPEQVVPAPLALARGFRPASGLVGLLSWAK